uniref:Uncharacterized protein n=1 Tax=Timema tahoe TaxID=61484 RepID=A0A7R9IRJ8_9NEOP|nr:unnamed protein product [Timema tahoe]
MPFTYRDKPSLSERLRGKSGDQLFQDLEKELEDNRKMFFETSPTWGTAPRSGSFSRSSCSHGSSPIHPFRIRHLFTLCPSRNGPVSHTHSPFNGAHSCGHTSRIYMLAYTTPTILSFFFPLFRNRYLKGFVTLETPSVAICCVAAYAVGLVKGITFLSIQEVSSLEGHDLGRVRTAR